MKFKKYCIEAGKTDTKREDNFLYLQISMVEEIGELIKPFRKNIWHEKPLPDNLKEFVMDEAGDFFWFFSRWLEEVGTEWFFDVKELSREDSNLLCDIVNDLTYDILQGDFLWVAYQVYRLIAWSGLTLEEVLSFNIGKLRKRHGETYNENFYKKVEGR